MSKVCTGKGENTGLLQQRERSLRNMAAAGCERCLNLVDLSSSVLQGVFNRLLSVQQPFAPQLDGRWFKGSFKRDERRVYLPVAAAVRRGGLVLTAEMEDSNPS